MYTRALPGWYGTRVVLFAILLVLTCGPALASAGDPQFTGIYDSYLSGTLARMTTDTESCIAAAKELASLFGVVPGRNGKTMLPKGTICDKVEIADSVMTVWFTLPAGLPEGTIVEADSENVGAELARLFVVPFNLKEVRIMARQASGAMRAPAETTAPAQYRGLHEFAPVAPAPKPEPEPPLAPAPAPEASLEQPAMAPSSGQGPVGTSDQPQGALSGRTIFFSGGHGWTASATEDGGDGSWGLERTLTQNMVEDYGNVDQVNFFAQYVFNAGGTVVCMRPLGRQTNEVVMDDTSAVFAPSGSWTLASSSTDNFGNLADYGDGTHNRMRYISTAASETATATYTPNIPVAGIYPVYCFANASANRTSAQLYRIRHSAGEAQVRINHQRVGRGWIWLGNYYFSQGANTATGSVVVSNLLKPGADSGYVIADAIRFGNGMGSFDRGAGVSGYEREAESNRYWIAASEAPAASTYNYTDTDHNDSIGAPPRMAAYMQQDDGQGYNGDIFLGFHTNASGGTARGSLGLITNSATVTNQSTFANLVATTLKTEADIECANWEVTSFGTYGPTYTSAYGEIGTGLNGQMCGTIIEVAFHDNTSDALLLRDPKARNVFARTQYHAVVKYFNQFDGGALDFLPDPPTRVYAKNNGSGGVVIGWAPVAARTNVNVHAATGYVVSRSTDGLNFGSPVILSGNGNVSTTITGLTQDQVYYFRVSATNAGGESMPSEVVAVRVRNGGVPLLIVNGYDRLDRYNNDKQTISGATVETLRLRRNNSYDYVRQHAEAIAAAGRWFDSASNEAVINGDVSLSNYNTLDWILGEESDRDDTFDSTEQTLVSAFLASSTPANPKNLFVSGSETGYELEGLGRGTTFYATDLRADYLSDSSGLVDASGTAGSILEGISANFAQGTDTYNVDSADVIAPLNGSTACMSYNSPGGATSLDGLNAIGGWQDPNFSGQTNADLTSTFQIVTTPKREGTGAADLYYVWGTGTYIREYNATRPSFPSNSVLSVWVYGDGSGNTLQLCVRDANDSELFRNTGVTVTWTGWQEVTWDLVNDTKVRWSGAGDNAFTGTSVQLDSFLFSKVGAATEGHLYFDQVTYTAPPTTGGTAAIQYSGTYKLVNFGFPFEAVGNATSRNQVMSAILNFFATPVPVTLSEFLTE